MAKLYEKQGEFTHALGVYYLLAKTDKQAKKKVKDLSKKLFDSSSLNYHPLISLIFTKQQLKNIKLLPNGEYKKFMLDEDESQAEPVFPDSYQSEEPEDIKEEIAEDEPQVDELDLKLDAGINLADFKQIATPEPPEPEKMPEPLQTTAADSAQALSSQTVPIKSGKTFEQTSVAELLKALAKHSDPQTNLSQITVGQIKKFLNL